MRGMKYIENSAVVKAAGDAVPVGRIIVTSSDANAACEFLTGGTNGTTVALVAVPAANTSVVCNLCGTEADFVNLTNAVVMVEIW